MYGRYIRKSGKPRLPELGEEPFPLIHEASPPLLSTSPQSPRLNDLAAPLPTSHSAQRRQIHRNHRRADFCLVDRPLGAKSGKGRVTF
jgi:hypothetical protein